jgi:transposase InsO family protein
MVVQGMVEGIERITGQMEFCETCVLSKHHKAPFPPSIRRAEICLECVHGDLEGPLPYGMGGMRYFMLLTDDYSGVSWEFRLRYKSDAWQAFRHWRAQVELQTGERVKRFRSDNGGEFGAEFLNQLREAGIIWERTIPDNPQQNGRAEQKIGVLLERSTCQLKDANMPEWFWPAAVTNAVYMDNRTAHKGRPCTPLELFTKTKPTVSHIRPFGCRAYAFIERKHRASKFGGRSRFCRLLGMEEYSKGYTLWDPHARKVIRSRDVIFDERGNLPMEGQKVDLDGLWRHIQMEEKDEGEQTSRGYSNEGERCVEDTSLEESIPSSSHSILPNSSPLGPQHHLQV